VARNINKQGENENSQMQWLAKRGREIGNSFPPKLLWLHGRATSIDKWWKNKRKCFLGEKEGLSQFIAFHLDSWMAEWLDAIWKCYCFSQGRATHLWIFLKAQHDLWARL